MNQPVDRTVGCYYLRTGKQPSLSSRLSSSDNHGIHCRLLQRRLNHPYSVHFDTSNTSLPPSLPQADTSSALTSPSPDVFVDSDSDTDIADVSNTLVPSLFSVHRASSSGRGSVFEKLRGLGHVPKTGRNQSLRLCHFY